MDYDQWHEQHAVDAAADAPWHKAVRERVDAARDVCNKRVLEIGCGRGGFACWLAGHAYAPAELVAADFSSTAIAMGKAHSRTMGLPHIDWQVADIQNLRWPDGYFDSVFSFETIEHVPDPPRAVAELGRVLKPGGRLFLTTPNYLGVFGAYRSYCWLRGKRFDEGGQPICQWTMLPRTRRWVRQAGLRIVDWGSVGHYLLLPGRAPVRIHMAERPRVLMRWFGHHSFIVATRA